jgi:hypothetical protein
MIMNRNSPSGWYKAKLHEYWVMQWVVVYYSSESGDFYFGINRLTPDKVKEIGEYVMNVEGNPHNNIVHR